LDRGPHLTDSKGAHDDAEEDENDLASGVDFAGGVVFLPVHDQPRPEPQAQRIRAHEGPHDHAEPQAIRPALLHAASEGPF